MGSSPSKGGGGPLFRHQDARGQGDVKLPGSRLRFSKEQIQRLNLLLTRLEQHANNGEFTFSKTLRFFEPCIVICGSVRSVGIATELRAGRSGDLIPVGDEIFPPVQTGPVANPASCTMGTGSFPGVKCGRGVLLTTLLLLEPKSWKSRAIILPPSGPHPGP